MNYNDDGLAKAFPAIPWLFQPAAPDVIAVLSNALSTDWVVARETDYEGRMSVITLPALGKEKLPSFILYERDGQTHVATITGDEWANDRCFDDFRQAVSVVVGIARAASIDGECDRQR
jgi:hypothetical protein